MANTSATDVRKLVAGGYRDAAAEALRAPVAALAGQSVEQLSITSDEYSLNSVSGIASLTDGSEVFFKFHTEDGEGDRVGEYYRAQVLAEAGLPIDVPLAVSNVPGQQLVLYRRRADPRMVDVCLELERAAGATAELPPHLAAARRALDSLIGAVAVQSIRTSMSESPSALHQLFSHRMHTSDGEFPGGRLLAWYTTHPEWPRLAGLHWEFNGVTYERTLAELVQQARTFTHPSLTGAGPVVIAHGDDHHGNVWVESTRTTCRLVLFDPAFGGDDLPALMALVKATFHNVFAHPLWLYHPQEIDTGDISVTDSGGVVRVVAPVLSPMRLQVLDSVVQEAWIPLLRTLADRGMLDPRWRVIVRSALLLCPLLVTNLLANSRPSPVRILGLAHVVMMGSEPRVGSDTLSEVLDRMQEAVDRR